MSARDHIHRPPAHHPQSSNAPPNAPTNPHINHFTKPNNNNNPAHVDPSIPDGLVNSAFVGDVDLLNKFNNTLNFLNQGIPRKGDPSIPRNNAPPPPSSTTGTTNGSSMHPPIAPTVYAPEWNHAYVIPTAFPGAPAVDGVYPVGGVGGGFRIPDDDGVQTGYPQKAALHPANNRYFKHIDPSLGLSKEEKAALSRADNGLGMVRGGSGGGSGGAGRHGGGSNARRLERGC